ncbi:hypothetical protein [Niastella sp. OAS944]|uniref:DUF6934 family protein n=1 Tax=Niastella sp. OAS944 TaxID=2664089 RepID=UPI0035C8723B|nr:hypothetical protein [Chitinophagaceae bacterium OAS944]
MKKYEIYEEVDIDAEFSSFEFISVGQNGRIRKRVLFTPTFKPGIFNLAFGDINNYGELDDLTISNNGDRNKILATILNVVDRYTNRFPDRYVFFAGSTAHRTRLYRIAISLHLEELSEMFDILADVNGDWEFVRFRKGLNVKAFLVKRKIHYI